ncbi:hypothetical protein BDW74DRAFT_153902 [Aspergillus multicolor]|uniref:BTB/POZ domain-containing protein n=1 Tax=Aspergillus multicolor TaxID=41759 RepID=UPI003CCCD6E3
MLAPPDVHIQISARHIALASPVFDRMLYGNFKEAQEFKEKGSVVIDVDSWDVDALLVVLNIMHSRLLEIPRKVTVEKLAKITVIADYYDCDSVRFFSSLWVPCLSRKPRTLKPREMTLGLWIAYFFRRSVTFNNYSCAIMEYSESVISSLGLPIPVPVINAMNNKRFDAIDRAVSDLYDQRDNLLSDTTPIIPGCSPECRSMLLGTFMRHMKKHNFGVQAPESPYVGIQLAKTRDVKNIQAPMWGKHDHHERS